MIVTKTAKIAPPLALMLPSSILGSVVTSFIVWAGWGLR